MIPSWPSMPALLRLKLLGLALAAALTTAPAMSASNTPAELRLLTATGALAAPGRITIVDMEGEAVLGNTALVVPKPDKPQVPESKVSARRSAHKSQADAVTLEWRDAWYAAVRLQFDQAMDLRGYLEQGTLEFDFNAHDLAKAGLNITLECGPDCSRKLNHVRASRLLQGRGWQRLAVPLACFQRDGADFAAIKRPFALESSGSGSFSVANVRLVRKGRPNISCPDWRTQSVTPGPLEEIWAMDWWMKRHQEKLAEVRAHREAGREVELVFIGDSITHAWEDVARKLWDQHFAPHHAVNLGFGGDRTENVLWRLQQGELDGMRPKLVVLMIGTNNTGDRLEDPATTAAGIRRLVGEIQARQPQARVLLLALYPRNEKPTEKMRLINNRINELLPAMADGQRVVFLNYHDKLMNADGTLDKAILPDNLHLSVPGYQIVADSLVPEVKRLLALPPL